MTGSDRREFLRATAETMGAFALLPAWTDLGRLVPEGEPELRIGVIGVGRQGRAILAELQKLEGVKVTAVCDIAPARLRAGIRRAGGAKGYDDARQVLGAKDVDAVIVATPTHLHADIAIDAMAVGKHVYCEAPLAAALDEAKRIAAAARDVKVVFQTGMQARTNPIYRLAWGFHRAGVLAEMVSLRAQNDHKTSWRYPADDPAEDKTINWRLDPDVSLGLAGELGTHQFDVFHWYLAQYPVKVRGHGDVRLWKDGRKMPDTEGCELWWPDGLVLDWHGTLANGYEGEYELLIGAMGAIRLADDAGWLFKEADAPTQGWEVYANRESFHDEQGITLIADATKLAKQGKLKEGVGLPNPPLYYALAAFVKSAAGGEPVACTAEEGVRAAAVGIAAHRAVASGEEVTIDPSDLEVK